MDHFGFSTKQTKMPVPTGEVLLGRQGLPATPDSFDLQHMGKTLPLVESHPFTEPLSGSGFLLHPPLVIRFQVTET